MNDENGDIRCACCHQPMAPRRRATGNNGGGNPKKYCSSACRGRYLDRGPDPVIRGLCEECGERIPESRRFGARYCSNKCSNRVSARAAYARSKKDGGDWRDRLRRFGIGREQYEAMLAAQGGKCAICATTEAGGRGEAFPWHIDHDHGCCPGLITCGKCVRGLVCQRCNHGLGYFRDDPQILRAAARYIEERRL